MPSNFNRQRDLVLTDNGLTEYGRSVFDTTRGTGSKLQSPRILTLNDLRVTPKQLRLLIDLAVVMERYGDKTNVELGQLQWSVMIPELWSLLPDWKAFCNAATAYFERKASGEGFAYPLQPKTTEEFQRKAKLARQFHLTEIS